jgi:hypothetical protein
MVPMECGELPALTPSGTRNFLNTSIYLIALNLGKASTTNHEYFSNNILD